MVFRARNPLVLSIVLLAACFSEPPTVPGGGDESGSDSSMSGTDTGSEAGSGSVGSGTWTTTGGDCDRVPLVNWELSSDIIIAVDPNVPDTTLMEEVYTALGASMMNWAPQVRVAVLATLPPPGELACDMGCPCSFGDAEAPRILYEPLARPEGMPAPNPLAVLDDLPSYDCIARPQDPPESTKHMVFVTNRANDEATDMPPPVADFLEANDVAFYAACSGCNMDDGGLVLQEAGDHGVGASPLTSAAIEQVLDFAALHRASCFFPWDGPEFDGMWIDSALFQAEAGGEVYASWVPSLADCTPITDDDEIYIEFFSFGDFVVLCPPACTLVQLDHVDDVFVDAEICGGG